MGGASQLGPGAVFGRYIVVEQLGRGAMGEVWVAIDPDLDRKVALKLLRPDRLARPEDRARLDAEARAMARLTHPNVVCVHDVGVVDGQLFIAMEFVAGEPLDHWIARGPHPWGEVLAILRQAGAGLAAAHQAGLVHRDFKPANVMIGSDGRVRVLDFGLARPEGSVATLDSGSSGRGEAEGLDSGGETRSRVTGTSGARAQGSPAYMAPEQHRGGAVDARSDLFSFCVTLYEALYGVRPFRGGNRLAVALAIVEGRIAELEPEQRARVPEWVQAIVVRGLALRPEQRFADIDALLAALERSPEQRRRRRMQIGGVVLAAVGLLGLGWAVWPEPAADLCADSDAGMRAVWEHEARAGLGERLKAIPEAPPLAGKRVLAGLDAHAQAWSDASAQLCRDRRARRLTDRLEATRELCLREHLARAEVLVELGRGEGDADLLAAVAARPFAAVRTLGDASECSDRTATEDPPTRTDEQLRARASVALGLALAEGTPSADRVASMGSEGDEDPELALLLARLAAAHGQPEDAQARLHQAAADATVCAPERAVEAWLTLIELELDTLAAGHEEKLSASELGEVAELIAYADALLAQDDRAGHARLGLLAGRLALLDPSRGRPALLDAALASLAEDPGDEADLAVALLELSAELELAAGRTDAAASARDQADQLALAAFGVGRSGR